MTGLSLSLTETNSVPLAGRTIPAPICDFRKAAGKSLSIPMTSPVLFISGESTGSAPGKRAKGNTASFTDICVGRMSKGSNDDSGSPAITRAAILATGRPIALATKGTVRLARGLTSMR